ncbi:MAG: surface-adhesin E family protein [Gemmatimonadaceae bacterium]
MSSAYTGSWLRFMVVTLGVALAVAVPSAARAQDHWTGIGAISGTVMYMDTTSLERVGVLRKVWIRSIDLTPKTIMVGHDSLTFDTVVALNIFDCSKGTRTVEQVHYLLGGDSVFDVADAHGKPEQLRSTSFFGAIYTDLCGPDRSR